MGKIGKMEKQVIDNFTTHSNKLLLNRKTEVLIGISGISM
jgi:hypothetical protein